MMDGKTLCLMLIETWLLSAICMLIDIAMQDVTVARTLISALHT